MSKKTNREILEFGIDYAKKCEELEEKLEIELCSGYTILRFDTFSISLHVLADCENAEKASTLIKKEEIGLDEFLDSEFYDGVLLCEGSVYEALYYYMGYGDTSIYGERATKTVYKELCHVLEKHGFQLDLTRGGSILLQCRESFVESMRSIGIEIE